MRGERAEVGAGRVLALTSPILLHLKVMSTSPPIQSPSVSERGPLVLLVDDDARSARVLAQMLREDGFNIEVVLDGARAIARLTHPPLPDALVTDLSMPHADGNSVTMFARSQRPGMPVIFVTGYPNLATSLAGEPSPTLLTKPVDYTELRAALLRVLPPRPVEPAAPASLLGK